jgi:UDP-N-acetylglucosamine--N-acetylmuramyl-(pentapeptide) pyrophosphoryl-undecaprenol N-acetylglucosamine transferase
MTIVVTGGGSGGHITPVLAVADALKQIDPSIKVVYIGQSGDGLSDVPAADPNIDRAESIPAGKLRRYHGEGLRQLLDLKTMWLNFRDIFRTISGFFEAISLLREYKPACVFIKGGFVGVPVGLAAALLRIPYVTHDSDAIPGLANRIVAPWAKYHAVALPKELYAYESHRTFTVGVPTHNEYHLVTESDQLKYKKQLGLAADAKVLLVTGGGLGAQRLNQAVVAITRELLTAIPTLVIFHTVGRANEEATNALYAQKISQEEQGRVHVLGYTTELYKYGGAADLIVMRAGATAIAEFAVQGKACVIVPNPFLTGGHQLKNAEALRDSRAVAIIDDDAMANDLPLLVSTISGLLEDDVARKEMGSNLRQFAHPDAAVELAELVLKAANKDRS